MADSDLFKCVSAVLVTRAAQTNEPLLGVAYRPRGTAGVHFIIVDDASRGERAASELLADGTVESSEDVWPISISVGRVNRVNVSLHFPVKG